MSSKLLALVAACLLPAATRAAGVCYSPFHAEKYFSKPDNIASVLSADMAQIASATGFGAVRTYHAQFYGASAADAAVAAGLQVAIGIQMVGVNGASYSYLDDDIAAAIKAATTHPESVLAIYAGNENLVNGDFGSSSADEIISVIAQVKAALKGTRGADVPVGTVQRLEEWLHAEDADRVAAASDVVGVNIYPFFTKGGESDMVGTLEAQWSLATAKLGANKTRLTETGWPSQGSVSAAGNTPSVANAQKYFAAFSQWAAAHSTDAHTPFYFMMYDLLEAHATDYEQHFGVTTATGELKFGLGSTQTLQASASGAASSSEVAGEADRSADELATTSTAVTPSPSPTVVVSSAVGVPVSFTSDDAGFAHASAVTNSSVAPATTAPSPTPSAASPMSTAQGTGSSASGSSIPSSTPEDVPSGSLDGSSSFSGSIGSSSGSSSAATNDGPDVGDVDVVIAPVSAPDLTTPATAAPTPSPSESAAIQKAKEIEAQEAQAKRAAAIAGDSGVAFQGLVAGIALAGVAVVAVIAVYVQKRRNEESENQVSITTADARDSTPSVYSDPLGTRFSSIVMITPNGDGVCIL